MVRESDLVEAKRLHDVFERPIKFIPGNHDIGDNVCASGSTGRDITQDRRQRYLTHFGEDWWSLDVPGWRIIGINSQLLGSGQDAEEEQWRFLSARCANALGRTIALFVHKPLRSSVKQQGCIRDGEFLDASLGEQLNHACVGGGLALVCSGHLHQFRMAQIDGVEHVWAPSTAFIVPDRYQHPFGCKKVGFVEHRLHEDGTHQSQLVTSPGATEISIADMPAVYGPME